MTLTCLYPLLLAKVEKKGRTKEELSRVVEWLTGYDADAVQVMIDEEVTYGDFFNNCSLHPNAHLITGTVCGYRVESLDDPFYQKARYLDKLLDELAQGRSIEKILRKAE